MARVLEKLIGFLQKSSFRDIYCCFCEKWFCLLRRFTRLCNLKGRGVSASSACAVGRNGDEFAHASLDRLK
jgi:hypothetical protein